MSIPGPESGAEGKGSVDDAALLQVEDQIDDPTVETIVIDQLQIASSTSKQATTMPALVIPQLSGLTLHSPSSEIVGTPFTTESRFEYPFPENNSTSDASPASSMVITPYLCSLSASATFTSSRSSLTLSPSPPSTITSFPPTFSLPADLPNYTSTHPKLRAAANPPVPPGLFKKRQRWSLGLLRRRSSSMTQSSEDSSPLVSPSGESGGGTRDMRASSDNPRTRPQATVMEEGAAPPLTPHIDTHVRNAPD